MAIPTRLILRGYHGKLYHDGEWLAQVPEFEIALAISNSDYQAAGEKLTAGVFVAYSQTLTFTETHIISNLFGKLLEHLQGGLAVDFQFEGELTRADGERDYLVCRSCEPDGTITGMSVAQGSILNRGWAWRVNEPIDPQSLLGALP